MYLSELVQLYILSRSLRSASDAGVFRIPAFKRKQHGQRAFSYSAAKTWNFVPFSVRHTQSILFQPSSPILEPSSSNSFPQWGAADAEIKVPSGENTELKRSPFKAWSRSVYSHTCYAYCQGFLPCLFLRSWSIHLNFFFQNLVRFFSCVGCG